MQQGVDYDIEIWHEEKTQQPLKLKLKFAGNPKPETSFVSWGASARHVAIAKHSGKSVTARIEKPVQAGTKLRLILNNCERNVGQPKSAKFLYVGD